MSNPQKRKGDSAEREAADILTDLLGTPCRRKLGAGRQDDTGDIDGVLDHVIQVASWKDTAAAAIQKPRGAEQQRLNAQAQHAATAFTSDWLAAEPCAAETIKQDTFGRWLARVFRADGSDLSTALLAAGHASLFSAPKDL